ncbi:hypothetical protein ACIQZB_25110 [Streptomyces sp. NPDC097727]
MPRLPALSSRRVEDRPLPPREADAEPVPVIWRWGGWCRSSWLVATR